MRFPLVCLLVFLLLGPARAAEPFFKKGDVIALIGGEDMVVAAEDGYLELLLTRALPDYHLRFRSLAWEGDTVFDQPRELNFPTLEESLDKIGATVVICQFGQMESLAGKEKIPDFIAAYQKLLERFSASGKRRIVIVGPSIVETATSLNPSYEHALLEIAADVEETNRALADLAKRTGCLFENVADNLKPMDVSPAKEPSSKFKNTRDGVHLSDLGERWMTIGLCQNLGVPVPDPTAVFQSLSSPSPLLAAIHAKNQLWFDYWRVQNWAFLAGDRTSQPSSRDWKDPSKRWFPAEREEFIPLIEAKEKEINALAAKLK